MREQLKSIAAELAQTYPDSNRDIGSVSMSLSREIGRHTGEQVVWIVFAVAFGLLLIACSNVANLLLVRAQTRQRQSAIQLSMGASPGRLIRLAMVETLTLFTIAAIVGTLLGAWMIRAVTQMIPFENRGYLPDYGEASINFTMLAFSLGLALVTALLFGLAPALETSRANVLNVLKESGSSVSQVRRVKRLRTVLAASQIALATILLSSTALLVENFQGIWNAPRGFVSNEVLTFRVGLNDREYPDATRRRIFFETVADAIAQPGQPHPAIARFNFTHESGNTGFRIVGQSEVDPKHPTPFAGFNAVSPTYFANLRTPLLQGRTFAPSDSETAPLAAIVNSSFVARHLQGRDPIGRQIQLVRVGNRAAEIVGVVADIGMGDDLEKGRPEIFVPFAQAPASNAILMLRSASGTALLPVIRRRVAAIDSTQPIYEGKTLDDRLQEQFAPYKLISGMLVWFGCLALALAAVGVYGVVAYSASQRTREIGIRAALGAGRPRLLQLFLRQGAVMLQAGLIPGLAGGLAAAMGLRSVLDSLAKSDLTTPLFLTALLLGATVLAATMIPAWRAASVDPQMAIRHDG